MSKTDNGSHNETHKETHKLDLLVLEDEMTVCRLPSHAPLPMWCVNGAFFTVTRTPDELSIICKSTVIPSDLTDSEGDWRVIQVLGQLDFSMVGVLAGLCGPLAEEGISIMSISTFNTDYILVKNYNLNKAIAALTAQGHKMGFQAVTNYGSTP